MPQQELEEYEQEGEPDVHVPCLHDVWLRFWALLMCALYLFAGPSLMVLNKYLMQNVGFEYPILLSGLGQFVTGSYAVLAVRWKPPPRPALEAADELRQWGPWVRKVLPIGVAKATTLASGNAAYLWLNLGFIQMLKAFSPVTVLLVGWLFGVERPRPMVILAVVTIALSIVMTIHTEPHGSAVGIAFMVLAQTAEAVSIVLTQWLLRGGRMDITTAQSVVAPSAVFALGVATLFLEAPRLFENGKLGIMAQRPELFCLASVLGLTINMLTFAVIDATSALTLKILATVRNVGGVLVGVIMFHESVPSSEWAAYAASLGGFALYSYVRSQAEVADRALARCVRRFHAVCPVLPAAVLGSLAPQQQPRAPLNSPLQGLDTDPERLDSFNTHCETASQDSTAAGVVAAGTRSRSGNK